jgi:hypothetical protein
MTFVPDEPHKSNEQSVSESAYRKTQENQENISQTLRKLRWTFALPIITMFLGLSAIIWGAKLAYSSAQPVVQTLLSSLGLDAAIINSSDQLASSIVITLYGVLIELIGVIFLLIYKTTINRATELLNEELQIIDKRRAWEAARRKIQYYMHENLVQVKWIFRLTLMVMFLGFLIIIRGAALASKDQSTASIVVTLSGVLVEFIGATFLFIYKSTMEQAKNYVNILERINIIGMSDLLIDSIESSEDLRDKARDRIAMKILSLHGVEDKEDKGEKKRPN